MASNQQSKLDVYMERAIDELTEDAGRLEPSRRRRDRSLAFRHLLLPVDDSPASRNALAWARRIATSFKSHVTTVAVVEPPSLGRALFGPDWEPEKAFTTAQVQVHEWIRMLASGGARATGRVARGFVVPQLVEAADKAGADLVVLGSKGAGPWARSLLGSIVDGTKNQVRQSVLIAKKPGPPRRILVATDGSLESKLAARAALDLAAAWKSELTVLYVVPRRTASRKMAPHDPFTESMPELDPSPWGAVKTRFLVLVGRPAEEIVKHAATEGIDLIVMGSRGLSGIRSMVPGGVSNRVVHAAHCSVLLVKREV